jgi:hypothetical protein
MQRAELVVRVISQLLTRTPSLVVPLRSRKIRWRGQVAGDRRMETTSQRTVLANGVTITSIAATATLAVTEGARGARIRIRLFSPWSLGVLSGIVGCHQYQ